MSAPEHVSLLFSFLFSFLFPLDSSHLLFSHLFVLGTKTYLQCQPRSTTLVEDYRSHSKFRNKNVCFYFFFGGGGGNVISYNKLLLPQNFKGLFSGIRALYILCSSIIQVLRVYFVALKYCITGATFSNSKSHFFLLLTSTLVL